MGYKFLLYLSYSYSVPVCEPIESELSKRGYAVKWFADEPEGVNAIRNKNDRLSTIQDVVVYKPDVVLTATDNVPYFISGLKVQIFHGFFSKKRPQKNGSFAHFRIRGFFDLYCTQGPSSTKPFKKLAARMGHFKIVETGWSKVDPLFPLEPNSLKNRRNILIASTFTKRLSLAHNNELFEEIKRLSHGGEFNLKMVLHPKIADDIKKKWQGLIGEHFEFHDTTNLIPLFKESDIMLADTTSAIQEYLLQLKPVVTFRHTINQKYLINITEVSELHGALSKALSYPKDVIDHIGAFVSELHPYSDGMSSQRVIDASVEMLVNSNSKVKRKPLNLIRKFKIRKKLNYWKF